MGAKAYIAQGAGVGGTTVDIIDTATDAEVGTITGLDNPFSVAVAPDNKFIYVSQIQGVEGQIKVVQLSDNTIIHSMGDGFLSEPELMAITPNGKYLYVIDTSYEGIFVYDLTTYSYVTTVSGTAGEIGGAVVTPDGRYVYATAESQGVDVIDTSTNAVVHTISSEGVGQLAVSPDGAYVYNSFIGFNAVIVIETATNTIVATIDDAPSLFIAITPNGKTLYVASPFSAFATVIDTASRSVVTSIPLGSDAAEPNVNGCAISPNGAKAYISVAGLGAAVIDTATNTRLGYVGGTSPAGIGMGSAKATPTRQKPRDDNLALGAVRQRVGPAQPSSMQNSYRQGFRASYS